MEPDIVNDILRQAGIRCIGVVFYQQAVFMADFAGHLFQSCHGGQRVDFCPGGYHLFDDMIRVNIGGKKLCVTIVVEAVQKPAIFTHGVVVYKPGIF